MGRKDDAREKKHSRRRGENDEDREVRSLMKKTGSSYSQLLALMHRYGHDPASIERAAQRLRTT